MRTAIVDGRSGVVAATGSAQNAGKVFVLFDDERHTGDASADWFPASVVVVTTPLDRV